MVPRVASPFWRVTNAVVNVGVPISLRFPFWREYTQKGIAGSRGVSACHFFEEPPYWFPPVASCHVPTDSAQGFQRLHIFPNTCCFLSCFVFHHSHRSGSGFSLRFPGSVMHSVSFSLWEHCTWEHCGGDAYNGGYVAPLHLQSKPPTSCSGGFCGNTYVQDAVPKLRGSMVCFDTRPVCPTPTMFSPKTAFPLFTVEIRGTETGTGAFEAHVRGCGCLCRSKDPLVVLLLLLKVGDDPMICFGQ